MIYDIRKELLMNGLYLDDSVDVKYEIIHKDTVSVLFLSISSEEYFFSNFILYKNKLSKEVIIKIQEVLINY